MGCTVVVVAVVASQSGRLGQRWVGEKYSLGDEKECCCEPYRGIGNCRPVELVSLTTYEKREWLERGDMDEKMTSRDN